jgi:diguanylate cyclase (GGDEF)-like protein
MTEASRHACDPAIARLQALAAGFREHAGSELRRMQQRLADPATVDAALDELPPLLHRLAGSGGTFGFDGLARHARDLQEVLRHGGNAAIGMPLGAILARLADAAGELAAAPLPHADPEIAAARAASSAALPAVDVHLLSTDASLGTTLGAQLTPFGYRMRRFDALAALAAAWREHLPAAFIVDLDGDIARMSAEVGRLHRQQAPHLPLHCLGSGAFPIRLAAARLGAWSLHTAPLDALRLVDRLDAARRIHVRPRRVLLVDDDAVLGGRYAGELERHGFDVCVLADPAKVLQALEAFHPDIAVFDMDMPACSGLELARVVRMHGDWPALPILCLAAADGLDARLSAATEGIDDLLGKPISGAALAAALHGRSERAQVLAALMQRDSLTGLLNHARIKEQLADEVARSRRNGAALSVAMLDIDRFKQVNDSFGHAAGDRVIRALAHLLRQRVRQHDSVGRYGGEEFLLLLPDCQPGAAVTIIEDIRQRFAGIDFIERGETFNVTLSAGIVGGDPTLGAQDLLVQSDRAMYRAKQGGRDRVVVA